MKIITGINKKNFNKKFKLISFKIKSILQKYYIIRHNKIISFIYDRRQESKYNDIILIIFDKQNQIFQILK